MVAGESDQLAAQFLRLGLSPWSRNDLSRPPSGAEQPIPLTLAQRGWYGPAGPTQAATEFLKTPVAYRLQGPLSPETFRQALEHLHRRRDALRMRYRHSGEMAWQEPVEDPPELEVVDLAGRDEAGAYRRIWQVLADAMRSPPDYEGQGPMTAWLFRLADDDHVFAAVINHSVLDNRAMEVLLTDLFAAVGCLMSGEPPPAAAADSYAEIAREEAKARSPASLQSNLEAWRKDIAGASFIDLRDPAASAAPLRSRAQMEPIRFPHGVRDLAYDFARARGVTMPVLCIAAFGAMLSRLARAERIVVGLVVDDRPGRHRDALGAFIRIAPLILDLGGDPTAARWIGRVKDAYIEAIDPGRAIDAHDLPGLSNVLLNLHKPSAYVTARLAGEPKPERGPLRVQALPRLLQFPTPMSRDFLVNLVEHPKLLSGSVRYAADRVAPEAPRWFAQTAALVLDRLRIGADEPMSRVIPPRD